MFCILRIEDGDKTKKFYRCRGEKSAQKEIIIFLKQTTRITKCLDEFNN